MVKFIYYLNDLPQFHHILFVSFLSKELSVELCFTEWNARKLGKLHVYKTKFVEEIGEVYSYRL